MHSLSLPAAIFININCMLGAGLFINTTELAHRTGSLSWLVYALVGLLMLPLILSIAHLVRMHPDGGFYTFGTKELHPFAGFFSAWAYFTGKLASAALMVYVAVLLIQAIVPALNSAHPMVLSIGILIFFGLLNTQKIGTGSVIQNVFLGAKAIPIIFVILSGLFFFSPGNIGTMHNILAGIPSSIPLVLYAILGFETACSLSNKIEDAHKNAPRAILISFATVIVI